MWKVRSWYCQRKLISIFTEEWVNCADGVLNTSTYINHTNYTI